MEQSPQRDKPEYYDDEIDLLDLWRTLMRRKVVVIVTLLLVIIAAAVYLYVTPRTYEAKLRLLLPTAETLRFSTPSHSYTDFGAKTTYTDFLTQLRLTDQWYQFVIANPDLFPPEEVDIERRDTVANPIKLDKDSGFTAEHTDILYQNSGAEQTREVLTRYLFFVRNAYVALLVDQVRERIEIRKQDIVFEIDHLRKQARLEREDEIERLREDLERARKLGIVENLLIRPGRDERSGSDVINIVGTDGASIGYLRGTKELTTAIEMLGQRESDDPYIKGLRPKELELELLDTLQLTPAQFLPYSRDGETVSPGVLIKPKARLVMVLSIAAGLMLGVFAAFFAEFLVRARAQE